MLNTILDKDEIFAKIKAAQDKQKAYFQIGSIKLRITKVLKLFILKGCICDVCGIEGKHFMFKKQKKSFDISLELIALTKGSKKRTMTMDHTIPQCMSGSTGFDNLVPMCNICNSVWKSKFDAYVKKNALSVIDNEEQQQQYLFIQ